ncbi:MAG TPA: branched-chain amino acid ABC transporter permease [bacterium]|nr:branched-chain amino acid ABC transporter permease [bacterium]
MLNASWRFAARRLGFLVQPRTAEAPARPAGPAAGRVWGSAAVLGVVVLLVASRGGQATAQATINGLVTGTYFALGAVGLSLIFGVLRLVNFAHGDMLTFGAYIALLLNVTLRQSIVTAVAGGVIATAALGAASELVIWRPMRARRAGGLQLLLIAIGLAFVIRNAIQLVAGADPLQLRVNVTTAIALPGGLRVGTVELVVVIVGLVVLLGVATLLRFSRLGKEMRALADNLTLAEVAGINTGRVIVTTWLVGGGLAGLAGVLSAAAAGVMTPNFGFQLLLSLFAAAVLGGIGNAYGAVVGGVLLGLAEEWSTMFIDPRWKLAVGFAILILTLLLRPSGVLGRPALK